MGPHDGFAAPDQREAGLEFAAHRQRGRQIGKRQGMADGT
jgi:hypothetical protein